MREIDTDDDIRTLQLDEGDVISDDEWDPEAVAGEKMDEASYDYLIGPEDGTTRVLKPSGDPLSVYAHDYIPEDVCLDAYEALRDAAIQGGKNTGNRFTATGKNSRKKRIKADGSVSNTEEVPNPMNPNTGIVGYFDRYPRIPYCRQTAYNINNSDKFAQAVPFFQHADEAFAEYVPDRYATQLAKAQQTEDDWLITQTAFTTVTVNLNWQTACHTDAGDLKEGFGVMPVISLGDYEGGYYIQPKYRIAYDVRTGDVMLSDVHEWHGNGPFHDSSGYYERLSCVLYYRREMEECGTQEEELDRAKRTGDGFGDPEARDADALDQVTTTDVDDAETGDDGGGA